MYTFLLALFGAACWGIAPAFGKIGLRDIPPLEGLAARTLITVLFVEGWFFLRGGTLRLASIPPQGWFCLAVEAFFATFVGDLAYYAAIKWGDIGPTTLVLASSPLISLTVGWLYLGEMVTPGKLLGAALVISGIVVLGFNW